MWRGNKILDVWCEEGIARLRRSLRRNEALLLSRKCSHLFNTSPKSEHEHGFTTQRNRSIHLFIPCSRERLKSRSLDHTRQKCAANWGLSLLVTAFVLKGRSSRKVDALSLLAICSIYCFRITHLSSRLERYRVWKTILMGRFSIGSDCYFMSS